MRYLDTQHRLRIIPYTCASMTGVSGAPWDKCTFYVYKMQVVNYHLRLKCHDYIDTYERRAWQVWQGMEGLLHMWQSLQSAGAAGIWRADGVGVPFMNIFISTWVLLVAGLLFALPMLVLRVKNTTDMEDEDM